MRRATEGGGSETRHCHHTVMVHNSNQAQLKERVQVSIRDTPNAEKQSPIQHTTIPPANSQIINLMFRRTYSFITKCAREEVTVVLTVPLIADSTSFKVFKVKLHQNSGKLPFNLQTITQLSQLQYLSFLYTKSSPTG